MPKIEEGEGESTISLTKRIGNLGGSVQLSAGEQLQLTLTRHHQMSLLSSKYYYARHFWYMFLPTISITMLSAIFAFAIKSELPISEDAKTFLAFVVGCSSIFNVFLQNMSNDLNYDHCYKSQRTQSLGLKNLLAEIEYLNSTAEGISHKQIEEIEKTMNTVMKQNDTPVPPPIYIAYDLVNTRLSLRLFPPVNFDRSDPNAFNKISWAGMMTVVHNELFNVFSNHRGYWILSYCFCFLTFPLSLPDPERAVKISIEKVLQVLRDEKDKNLYTTLLGSQELIRISNLENAVVRERIMKKYSSVYTGQSKPKMVDAPTPSAIDHVKDAVHFRDAVREDTNSSGSSSSSSISSVSTAHLENLIITTIPDGEGSSAVSNTGSSIVSANNDATNEASPLLSTKV